MSTGDTQSVKGCVVSRRRIVGAGVLCVSLALVAGCRAGDDRLEPSGVADTFRKASLPLLREKFEGGDVFEVGDGEVDPALMPLAVFTSTSGRDYYVVVYKSVGEAEDTVSSASPQNPITGASQGFLRRRNVVAVIQPPDSKLRPLLERTLESLGHS